MPMRGAGFITGNKEVHDGKVRDLPQEELVAEKQGEAEAAELEREGEYTPEPEKTEEHAEPV